jgi:hypothetical protein
MRSGLRIGVCWLFVLGCVGCSSIRVETDWDASVSFERMQRFVWEEPPDVEGASPFADNTLLRKRVRSAIEKALGERGFRQVETTEAADFQVTYSVILEDRLRVRGGATVGVGGYHRYGWGYASMSPDVRNYQESTLIIDVHDPATHDLLWRGWAGGIVGTRDRNRDVKRLDEGVRKILMRFPPDAPEASDS